MAKRTGTILAGVFAVMYCASLWAQQKPVKQVKTAAKPAIDTAAQKKRKSTRPLVYLGHSNFSGGPITVSEFSSLLRQGITSRNAAGTPLKVVGFTFNYAERRLYENEQGDMSMQIDMATEFCAGDTITSNIAGSIYDRIKGGDTIYISQVELEEKIGSNLDTIWGKELKCVIRK